MATDESRSSPRIALRDEQSLNVLIPMGGKDDAFVNAGYKAPKPLIRVAGRPMICHIIDNLKLRLGDVVWLVTPQHVYKECEVELERIRTSVACATVRIVTFAMQTRGAVETLYIGLQHMTPAELSRKTICLDANNIYFSDVLGEFRRMPRGIGSCFYFVDDCPSALFSYIALDDESRFVRDVAEKVAISEYANVGAYGFASAATLCLFAQETLDSPRQTTMKFHLSKLISEMLRKGHSFAALEADNVTMCGTPHGLEAFVARVSRGKALEKVKRRFCFGLDDVLVSAPRVAGDYSTVVPIQTNVELVRELKEAGHTIIIVTSRLMLECNGNVGAVVAQVGNQTLETLTRFGIPYDELHFGRPAADLYVDRAVACSASEAEKEIGWCLSNRAAATEDGMIAARHFNQVKLDGECVIKTSATSVLRGELFFYQHMPADIADIFPRLIDYSATSSPRSPASEMTSMTLQRVSGVTFSHLVTSRCLTVGRLQLFLGQLRRIHNSAGDSQSLIAPAKLDVGVNYLPKVQKRFAAHEQLYLSLAPNAGEMFKRVCVELEAYMRERRFQLANVIHGDPVFSNVLLSGDNSIHLLDMRGEIGETLTLQGDILYDLSKVYQSLLGYDYILLGKVMHERDAELLEELRDAFSKHVAEHYPSVAMSDVVRIAAQHYFGIVPLHRNSAHQRAYLETCSALLASLPPI